jgi:hypothetical protein
MRLMRWLAAGLCVLLVTAMAGLKPAAAQGNEVLLPEQSAAKAKSILQQVIAKLGGGAYLNVRDTDCSGRLAQFGNNGAMTGFTQYRDTWLLPDKNRKEYIVKGEHTIAGFLIGIDGLNISHGGVIIMLFNGDQGWILDKSGVSDQPEDVAKTFAQQVKSGMDAMLRSRLNERGLDLRYAGTDVIDLKEAEWIEFTDKDRGQFRLGLEKSTHLPLRWVVQSRDPKTQERTETVTSYSQFTPVDGVLAPVRIARAQDGRDLFQIYFDSCKYNSNLSPDLFTRSALEQRSHQAGSKDNKSEKPDNKKK